MSFPLGPTNPADPNVSKGHASQPWKGPDYPKNKIPEPTIGRMVYYYHPSFLKPCAAVVADCDGYTVNLGVVNHDGTGFAACGVQHAHRATVDQAHWDWMPFQKGQAVKTEELERELAAKIDPNRGTSFSGQGAAGAVVGGEDPK
jgi:hypothetical protein